MADTKTKQSTGGRVTEGKGGTARSVALNEPVVQLVDLASTSGEQGSMKCPVAPVRKLRRNTMRGGCSEEDDDSDSSIMSAASTASGRVSRKRGRPPTTGEYVGLAEAKQRLLDLTQQQEQAEMESRILDRNVAIETADRNMRSDEDVAEDLRKEPSGSLAAIVAEDMQLVRKAAKMSSNLKGTVQRALKESAQRTRLAMLEMAKRQGGDCGRSAALEEENRRLRSEVEGLKEELRSLSAQVERLLSEQVSSLGVGSQEQEVAVEMTEVPSYSPSRSAPAPSASTPGAGEAKVAVGENGLLDQISVLIDRKLAAFYLDLFPERAARPPLGTRVVPNGAPQQENASGETTALKPKKKSKGRAGKVVTTPPASITQPSRASMAGAAPPGQNQPAAPSKPAETPWTEVVGRKAARKPDEKTGPKGKKEKEKKKDTLPAKAPAAKTASKAETRKMAPPRAPKSAAVTITVPEGCSTSYADAMKAVRQKVSLQDIGIGQVRPRRALTGGLILEVPGPEGAEKAKALAGQMSAALAGTGVKVAQPTKQAEIRVRGLDDSVTPDEVVAALANAGGCAVGEIKVGDIRRSPTGLGTIWARCPAAAARKVVISGRLMVGWVAAKVDALEARPLQCHRCLEMGHVRQRCTSTVDRSAMCYHCGAPGHRAGECQAKEPECPICKAAGKPANHRMGSKKCSPSKKGKKETAGMQGPTTAPSAAGAKPSGANKNPAKPTGKPAQGGSGLEEAMELN